MQGPHHYFRMFRTLVAAARCALADARARASFEHVTFAGGVVLRGTDRIVMGSGVFLDRGAYLNPSTVNQRRGYITIGDNVEIGPYNVLWGGGGLTIGNNVHFGAHVHVTTQQGRIDVEHARKQPIAVDTAPVTIEDDVLIYSGATIVPGVRIGKGAIVAAGAVVTRDVPAGVRVGGVPARTLRGSRVVTIDSEVGYNVPGVTNGGEHEQHETDRKRDEAGSRRT